jgi:hypothetical protein
MDQAFENRLDNLRQEAKSHGTVQGAGVHALGGPLPGAVSGPTVSAPGYYGLPVIKPPVWKWMIPAYFFVGGLAGMAGLIALAGLNRNEFELVRVSMWAAAMGAIVSPVLLTLDLGRPRRFINMLRVFKYQSPMSVGSWIVSGFGAFSLPGLALVEWQWQSLHAASYSSAIQVFTYIFVVGSGLIGILLATYTGALLAVTAVPVWNIHRVVLPFHFGMAGLGSAAGLLELVGFQLPALNAVGFFAASAETLVMLWLEWRKHGAADRALHEGKSGWTLRAGEALEGPVALILRSLGWIPGAAIAFLAGALVTRFGWLLAGEASAVDPESVFASQQGPKRAAQASLPYVLGAPRSSWAPGESR